MSGTVVSKRIEQVRAVAETDVGTPLWFIILMAIFVTVITFVVVGIFITNSKVKKNAGYKGGAPPPAQTI